MFSPTDEIKEKEGWKYFRLCFAAVTAEEVEKSSKRFAEAIKAFWMIKDKKEMEDIEDEAISESVQGEVIDLAMGLGC